MTDDQRADPTETENPPGEEAPQYGIGPFTIREVALLGVWLVAFVVSFFPLYTNVLGRLGAGLSVWTIGLEWILTIGVPTVAVFLIVLRRFSPSGIRRVGSLGIDQFASVAFSVSATIWLVALWNDVSVVIANGVWVRTWVVWVEFVLMLAGVVLTVLAPVIPLFAQDFEGRPEAPAHRSARPVRAVSKRPARVVVAPTETVDPFAPPAEAAADSPAVDEAPAPLDAVEPEVYTPEPEVYTPETDTAAYRALGFAETGAQVLPEAEAEPVAEDDWTPQYARNGADADAEPVGYRRGGAAAAEPAPEPEPEPVRSAHQAFWALAPEERDVHDEHGVPIFRIGPTAWALVIEDRGSLFVIRHEDGRIGYLHDVSGVTRG